MMDVSNLEDKFVQIKLRPWKLDVVLTLTQSILNIEANCADCKRASKAVMGAGSLKFGVHEELLDNSARTDW